MTTYEQPTILLGDNRRRLSELPDESVQCCVTSPPYWGLRDYGHQDQIGAESLASEFVSELTGLFEQVRRILKPDGTLWLNLGDSYAGNNSQASNNGRAGFGKPRERLVSRRGEGLKNKDLVGIPWRVAFALQGAGWYLRQDIIWHKPNPLPESVTDRCTKAHEYLFLLTKRERYYFDAKAISEQANGSSQEYETKNKRSVWTVNTKPFDGAHFAVMPEDLVVPCVLAGSRPGDLVLDPFAGSGTTGAVALRLGRQFVGCELNPDYAELARQRIDSYHLNLFNQKPTVLIP